MRKKAVSSVMAHEDDSNATQQPQPGSKVQSQESDFAVGVKRLRRLAHSAAQALFTNTYLQRSPSVATELVTEIHALAAILTGFEDDILLASAQGGGDRKDMWTWDHHQNITRSIRECDHALVEIDRAVRTAEVQSRASLSAEGGQNRVEGLYLHNGSQLLDIILECFRLVAQTKVIARYSALSRVDRLNDDETREKSRLIRALQHADLQAIWTHRDAPPAPKQVELSRPSSYSASAARVEPSEARPSPASGTPESSPKPEHKMPEEKILPIWAYNQWPPFGNYQHPAYLAAMAKSQDRSRSPVEGLPPPTYGTTSNRILASIPSIEPLSASTSASRVGPGTTKPGILFGEPSVTKPISSGPLFPQVSPFSAFATYSQSKANPFNPTAHLEAYILRPTVHTTELASTLSYRDEPLRLGEETLQSQIRNLDPEHSIVDVLLDLHPLQLNLVQRRALQRHGQIVSVRHGRLVNVDTVMGSLLVKPVVYIISTTTILPQEGTGNPFSTLVTDKPAFSAGTFGPSRSLVEAKPLFTPSFGISDSNPPAHSGSHLASPEAYSRYLQETGEVCTYVEGTECKGQYQHYQTITANKDRHGEDLSLEEIRLADYQAGRKVSGGQVEINNGRYLGYQSAAPSLRRSFGDAPVSSSLKADLPKAGTSTTIQGPSVLGVASPDGMSGVTSPYTPGKTNESSSTDMTKRLSASPSHSSSSGYPGLSLEASVLPKPTQSSVNDTKATTKRQPSHEGNAQTSPDATRVPKNPLSAVSSTDHPGFGPPVGAADPSDQSKWITHPQRFCEIQHQHGFFCRVSPAEALRKTEALITFPAPEPLVSSGFDKFAGTSSKSPFASFTSKSPVLSNSTRPASSQNQSNSLFGKGSESHLSRSPAVSQAFKDDHTGDSPPLASHPPCSLFECRTCRPTPGPTYNKFDWASAGPQPKPPSWSKQTKSVPFGTPTILEPSLSGAAAASHTPSVSSGFSTSKPSDAYVGKAPTERGLSSVGAVHATSEPSVSFPRAGLFGQGSKASSVPPPHVSQPTATPAGFGLFGVGPYRSPSSDPVGSTTGQTSATKASSSSQSSRQVPTNNCDPTQATPGAINGTKNTGSSERSVAASASTPAAFGQPILSIPSAPTPNLHSHGLDQPVKATAVAPGTIWSGRNSNTSSSSRLSPLQDYQRQLKELEERDAALIRAETVARRGPHDDAALAELLDSEKLVPIQVKDGASLIADSPEKAGASSSVEFSHAAKRVVPLGLEKSATVAEKNPSSFEDRKIEDVQGKVSSGEKHDKVEAARPFGDANAARQ